MDSPFESNGRFEAFDEGNSRGYVLRAEANPIREALLGRGDYEALSLGGRGALRRFMSDAGPGVVREYKRGGIIRHFLDGVYLTNRPMHEFRVHQQARARGVSVPEVLGVICRRHGVWYSGAFATRYIDGENLLAVLKKDSEGTSSALTEAARATRKMHDAGVCHADLQLLNLLWDGSRAYILDLDNAIVLDRVSPRRRESNMRRLKRSFEKHGYADRFDEFRDVYSSSSATFASSDKNP